MENLTAQLQNLTLRNGSGGNTSVDASLESDVGLLLKRRIQTAQKSVASCRLELSKFPSPKFPTEPPIKTEPPTPTLPRRAFKQTSGSENPSSHVKKKVAAKNVAVPPKKTLSTKTTPKRYSSTPQDITVNDPDIDTESDDEDYTAPSSSSEESYMSSSSSSDSSSESDSEYEHVWGQKPPPPLGPKSSRAEVHQTKPTKASNLKARSNKTRPPRKVSQSSSSSSSSSSTSSSSSSPRFVSAKENKYNALKLEPEEEQLTPLPPVRRSRRIAAAIVLPAVDPVDEVEFVSLRVGGRRRYFGSLSLSQSDGSLSFHTESGESVTTNPSTIEHVTFYDDLATRQTLMHVATSEAVRWSASEKSSNTALFYIPYRKRGSEDPTSVGRAFEGGVRRALSGATLPSGGADVTCDPPLQLEEKAEQEEDGMEKIDELRVFRVREIESVCRFESVLNIKYGGLSRVVMTRDVLASFQDFPPYVVPLRSIETVVCERVCRGASTCDMSIFLKTTGEKKPISFGMTPKHLLPSIRSTLALQGIKLYETTALLHWKNILKEVNADHESFYVCGGWSLMFSDSEGND